MTNKRLDIVWVVEVKCSERWEPRFNETTHNAVQAFVAREDAQCQAEIERQCFDGVRVKKYARVEAK